MRKYRVTYQDGRTEIIEADDCWPNDWGASFMVAETRQSKLSGARPGDTTSKLRTFRFVSGKAIAEIREVA